MNYLNIVFTIQKKKKNIMFEIGTEEQSGSITPRGVRIYIIK